MGKGATRAYTQVVDFSAEVEAEAISRVREAASSPGGLSCRVLGSFSCWRKASGRSASIRRVSEAWSAGAGVEVMAVVGEAACGGGSKLPFDADGVRARDVSAGDIFPAAGLAQAESEMRIKARLSSDVADLDRRPGLGKRVLR